MLCFPALAATIHQLIAVPLPHLQDLDLSYNTYLPASSASSLTAASRLRRLSLAHTLPHDCRLPPAMASLQHLTFLDVGYVASIK